MTKLKESAGIKLVIIIAIAFFLWIGSLLIGNLVNERMNRSEGVKFELGSKWGNSQTVTGPILTLVFTQEGVEGTKTVHLLPEELNIHSEVTPVVKRRSIYTTVLYSGTAELEGHFDLNDFYNRYGAGMSDIREAFISIGVSDVTGLSDPVNMLIDGVSLGILSGSPFSELYENGFHGKYETGDSKLIPYSISFGLRGNESVQFVPLGKKTTARLTGSWADPSFQGAFLPIESTITETSFETNYNILHLNRSFPQIITLERGATRFQNSAFGVSLITLTDHYQKTERTIKYALMFIGLTFIGFFLVEVMNKVQLHPINYLLIGLSLILFYVLLLALSEHISFNAAYLGSALVMVGLISFYSGSILKDNKLGYFIAGVLSFLYLFLFVIMQLAEYALLAGSIVMLVILAFIMLLTRKIDWYTVFSTKEKGAL